MSRDGAPPSESDERLRAQSLGAHPSMPVIGGITQLTGHVTAGPGSGTQAATIPVGTVTLAMQANLANQRVIGRNTAGSGVPEAVTASQLFDWLASTRGAILVRGAALWVALAIGTAGRQLVTDGTDPLWRLTPSQQLLYGTGDDGSLTFDGTAAVTINGTSVAPSGGVYTLVDDVDAQTITMSGTAQIKTVGFVIRCWSLVMGASNVIKDDGNDASGSTFGNGLVAAGPTQRTSGGGNAGKVAGTNGSAGSSQADSMGGAGGVGGSGNATSGGGSAAASRPVATRGRALSAKNILSHWLSGTTGSSVNNLTGGAGGASGGGGTAGNSGGGGGGGGVVWVYAATVNATAGAVIRANGGIGGNAPGTNAGGGGGGGGGVVVLVSDAVVSAPTLQANGGAGGTGSGTGTAGGAGVNGTTKTVSPAA